MGGQSQYQSDPSDSSELITPAGPVDTAPGAPVMPLRGDQDGFDRHPVRRVAEAVEQCRIVF